MFTETFYTAPWVCAPSRRAVEAREHTSTVLDHLLTHIVDVPFCVARSTEERAHGCSVSFATAACPGTRHVMRKPGRRPTSHTSHTHGASESSQWPSVLFVSDSSSRRLTAPLQQATGSPRARTPPSSVGKRLHQPASAAGFAQIRMAGKTTATRHPDDMLLMRPGCRTAGTPRRRTETPLLPAGPHPAVIRRPAERSVCGKHCGCRTSVVRHMVNAHVIARFQALREFDFRGEPEPPEIPPETPPRT
ncbi:hypothetical protein MOQ_003986 [Trypanosoma cruzi marinkellei]|uniref:Uncharacterized protein n=1 Tax=Trypanosoma cruzi marinkellei TaxID=85056 RepID=K2MYN2_TRYCR|nr:hypothetical protein MOQ_003986 [Trypanosoma cruzi marinkellei]